MEFLAGMVTGIVVLAIVVGLTYYIAVSSILTPKPTRRYTIIDDVSKVPDDLWETLAGRLNDLDRIAPPTPKFRPTGHYFGDCSCPNCQRMKREKSGICLDKFVNLPLTLTLGEPVVNKDEASQEIMNAITPIKGCTCAWCEEAREDDCLDITPEAAAAALEELNKKHGFAL